MEKAKKYSQIRHTDSFSLYINIEWKFSYCCYKYDLGKTNYIPYALQHSIPIKKT